LKWPRETSAVVGTIAPMAILRTRTVWRKALSPDSLREKNRLTESEELNVRKAMLVLLIRHGNWRQVAKALKTNRVTITRVVCIRRRATPAFAMRVARLLGEPLGDVLSGAFPRAGECPMCAGTGRCETEWDWQRSLSYFNGVVGRAKRQR
jgi:hypothetical protein